MKPVLSPDLAPTACLEVDSASARELTWLPYAVRFKLDECGLGLSLRQWQQLPIARRAALVRAPLLPGLGGFATLALASGAKADASRQKHSGGTPEASDLEGLQAGAAGQWLARATPFSRYVLAKLARKALHEAA